MADSASMSTDELLNLLGEGGGAMRGGLAQPERDLAIRTVIGEAAKEPFQGQLGVARVIRNRLGDGGYGKSMSDVLFAPRQFEPWTTRRRELMAIDPKSSAYQEASRAVDLAWDDNVPDPTKGALNFANADIVQARGNESGMSWIGDMQSNGSAVKIGRHTFGTPRNRPGASQADAEAPATAYANLQSDGEAARDFSSMTTDQLVALLGDAAPKVEKAAAKREATFNERFAGESGGERKAMEAGMGRLAEAKYGRMSQGDAFGLGAGQGFTWNYGDELGSALDAVKDRVTGNADSLGGAYEKRFAVGSSDCGTRIRHFRGPTFRANLPVASAASPRCGEQLPSPPRHVWAAPLRLASRALPSVGLPASAKAKAPIA